EPPPNTVFLLVSNSLDRLLPTILSRCRKFALSMPASEDALQWLRTQDLAEPENWLAEQGGAPLAALDAANNDSHESMALLLQQLARPAIDTALKTADTLQKTAVPVLVGWLQRWMYDVLSIKLTGAVRYYPRYRKELERLAAQLETGRLLDGIKQLNERRAIADHPLAPRLFIEDMLLDYVALFS